MKTIKLLLGFLFIVAISATCVKPKDHGKCPDCNVNASWSGYGDIKFSETGYDGALSDEYPSIDIESDCGWTIYRNNAGGTGNTYEVFSPSCDTSVVLIWMWGSFSAYILNDNWQGYFNNPSDNIKIGCSLDNFLRVYPNYKPWAGDGTFPVTSFFMGDNALCYLYVYYVNNEHYDISYAEFSLDKKLNLLYITGYPFK